MMAILGLLFCCDHTMSFLRLFFLVLSMLFRVCVRVGGCIMHSSFFFLSFMLSCSCMIDTNKTKKEEEEEFEIFFFFFCICILFSFFFSSFLLVQFVYYIYTNRELFSFDKNKFWKRNISHNHIYNLIILSKRKSMSLF
jgi:hypothetical protein